MTMKLIDADALKTTFRKVYKLNGNGVIGAVIDDAPTVDAIPIEWLIKHISTIEQQRLLEEWEEENGQVD